ncbi:phosphoribosylaminoimidazole-succinocarboxamide synthase [Amanita rubescens]|nr:phosphoribosylaminoimidazole-succinocarboxamide synthase [Amanita rubescens]
MALITSHLPDLTLLSTGKVRDIYQSSRSDSLLFVASDRISAYDVILKNGIPDKGKLLTKISLFWFDILKDVIPNHLITADIDEMPEEVHKYRDQLEGRAMLVKKAKVIPIEAIAHGIHLPEGLVESQKLSEPIFTPSTKAEPGKHDENISPEQAAQLIGQDLYDQISSTALQLYRIASEHALERGVILADTKFEFGLLPAPPGDPDGHEQLILIDEVLTPDSSRYWPLASYSPGKSQPSFDKQYVRDWLVKSGFRKGLESGPESQEGQGWKVDDEVVKGTRERYAEAVELLTRP